MGIIKNITDEGVFSGGYFILNPDIQKVGLTVGGNLIVTYPEELSLKRELINMIREAKSSIKICSFVLTDMEIFTELQKVLETKNTAVFIITQLDESKFSTSFLTEDELSENRYQTHLDFIKKLYCFGAHIRASKSAHAKFIIADRMSAIIMSANLTSRSLNQNPESGIPLSDTNSIQDLDNLFDIIFQEGTNYVKFVNASKNKQFIVSREIYVNNDRLNALLSNSLRFTYEIHQRSLYEGIIKIIQNAKSEVLISTYSIVALDFLPELLDTINKFIRKNGKIKIFCRAMNYRSDHLSNCSTLRNLGCEIFGDFFNHSKGIVSDDEGMLFTANIDGNHGLKSGLEVGYITDSYSTLALKDLINWQILTAPFQFIMNPLKKDYFLTYNNICQQKNVKVFKTVDVLRLRLEGDSMELLERIDKVPIYFFLENNNLCMVSVGNEYYRASQGDSGIILDKRLYKFSSNYESYLLRYKTLNLVID